MPKVGAKGRNEPAQMPASRNNQRSFLFYCLILLLAGVTLATYEPVRGCGFVNYDDPDYVLQNPHVLNGLTPGNIKWAFTHFHAYHWHPLTWVSLMLDCQFWGTNAGAFHLVNLAWHVINTLLVFVLLKQMTAGMWRSALVAAFFALHPLRVESVAWISERKDVLSTFFWLLTIEAYYRYTLQLCWRRYMLVILCFSLGLLSKPMLVTLPFALLLLDYWPLARLKISPDHQFWRDNRHLIWEKFPIIFLSVVSCTVTFLAQQQGGAIQSSDQFPLLLRLVNVLMGYAGYLAKLFWPTNLIVIYPFAKSFSFWHAMGSAVLLMGITALTIVMIRRRPYLFVGWCWYLGTLVPVIGFIQNGEQAMCDRYTYIPSLGIFLMAIWGMCELTHRWRHRTAINSAVSILLICLCFALTRKQLKYWRDSETLFSHAVEVMPDNSLAHNNLALALDQEGRLDEAIFHYREAIRSRPNYFQARYNLASVLLLQGHLDEAILQLKEAVFLAPSSETRNNLGVAFAQKGRIDEAISQFEQAIRLDPQNAEAHANYGLALARKGRAGEAILQLREAIRLKPDTVTTRSNLAMILAQKDQLDEAIGQYQEIIQRSPNSVEARNNLGALLMQENRLDEAMVQFQTAIHLQPGYTPAQTNLDMAIKIKSASSR